LPDGITLVILEPMKTAVSIPDSIFHAADSLAKRLGMSRSELFSHALEAYLETHKHDHVREALDAIYSEESSGLDETFGRMQWASLPKEDW
jgi:metal-responsive CopG/Arc/MetJ family transcriptional regulator